MGERGRGDLLHSGQVRWAAARGAAEIAGGGSGVNSPSVFRYYSGVRRTLLSTPLFTLPAIGLLSALIGCYSGSHPARIGSNAPDFTVQDSDHKITLSPFPGHAVIPNFCATSCPPS